jgi:hypothetical protein
MKTYLVVIKETHGYILDVYPDERDRNLLRYAREVVGEYDNPVAAKTALYAVMKDKCDRAGIQHWWH